MRGLLVVCLRHISTTGDCLILFDLKAFLEVSTFLPFRVFLIESFIFVIYVLNQFLDMVTCYLVLIHIARADAQVKRLVRLLLAGTLFKAGAAASEPQLHDILVGVAVSSLAALLNNFLHITALSTY
jgi:hypothetical protein